jgi:hypothetical protein
VKRSDKAEREKEQEKEQGRKRQKPNEKREWKPLPQVPPFKRSDEDSKSRSNACNPSNRELYRDLSQDLNQVSKIEKLEEALEKTLEKTVVKAISVIPTMQIAPTTKPRVQNVDHQGKESKQKQDQMLVTDLVHGLDQTNQDEEGEIDTTPSTPPYNPSDSDEPLEDSNRKSKSKSRGRSRSESPESPWTPGNPKTPTDTQDNVAAAFTINSL